MLQGTRHSFFSLNLGVRLALFSVSFCPSLLSPVKFTFHLAKFLQKNPPKIHSSTYFANGSKLPKWIVVYLCVIGLSKTRWKSLKWVCVRLCLKAAVSCGALFFWENNCSHCACNPRVEIVFAGRAPQRSTYVRLHVPLCITRVNRAATIGWFLVSRWNLFYIKCFTAVSQGVKVLHP